MCLSGLVAILAMAWLHAKRQDHLDAERVRRQREIAGKLAAEERRIAELSEQAQWVARVASAFGRDDSAFSPFGADYFEVLSGVVAAVETAQVVCQQSLERMDPFDFEQWSCDLFSLMGWSGRVTKGSGDEGVDVFLHKGDSTGVIQCKKYPSGRTVAPEKVRALRGAMEEQEADCGYLVTTAGFSGRRKKTASTQHPRIWLIDGEDLRRAIEQIELILARLEDAAYLRQAIRRRQPVRWIRRQLKDRGLPEHGIRALLEYAPRNAPQSDLQ